MDLKTKEVAELLNVSEITVQRWVREGLIPYYKLQDEHRFSREEIENWVLSSRQDGDVSLFDDGKSQESLGTKQFGLYRAIHKGGVYTDIEGTTKEEVIRASVECIASDLGLDEEVITSLLLDREKLMPTALSHGVAVPHTRDFLLQESFDVVSTVYLKNPIPYGALDQKPVDTLFFLFACDDKRHLNLLAKLAHFNHLEANRMFLRTKPSKLMLLEYMKSWESKLQGVSAGPELALRV